MSYLIPPRDFWPLPSTSLISGVTSAVPPLYIAANTISIVDATATNGGIVNTGAQIFGGAKDFKDGFTANTTQTITSISTDNTFTVAENFELATKKAIKDYLASLIFATGVNEPLYMNLTNIDIRDATSLIRGVINTTTQSFGGNKTFANNVTVGGSLLMSSFPVAQIQSSVDGGRLYITSNSAGSSIETQSLGYGGHLLLQSSTFAGTEVRLRTGSPLANRLVVSDALINAYLPTVIISTGPQLSLSTGSGGVTFNVVAGGDLTIDASGNDINMHSTDMVHVLNSTASTSKTTGAFTVNGGIGCSDRMYSSSIALVGTTSPHIQMTYTSGQQGSFYTSNQGQVTMDSTGTSPRFDISFNGTPAHTLLSSLVTFTSPLVANQLTSTNGTVLIGDILNNPTVRPNINNKSLILQGGTTFTSTSGAGMELQSTTSGGNMILFNGIGGSIQMQSFPVPAATVFEVKDNYARTNYVFETNGMMKYKSTEEKYSPAGAGPFNDFLLTSTAVVYRINLVSVTTGAHFTGFDCDDLYRSGRTIKIYFMSLTGSKTIYIDNDSGSSLAKNRISCPNSSNITLVANPVAMISIEYPGEYNKWIVAGMTGVLITPSFTSSTVVHNLDGAALGSTVTIVYQQVGTMIMVHLGTMLVTSVAPLPIYLLAGSEIPVAYRPTVNENGNMITVNGVVDVSNTQGRYIVRTSGAFEVYSDENMNTFVGTGTAGWIATTLLWYKT